MKGHILISQFFPKPEEQKYGKEIIDNAEKFIGWIKKYYKILEIAEYNRHVNYQINILREKVN